MKPERIESLVSWMWTGAVLIGVGLFFLIRGWFFTELGDAPLQRRGYSVDPHIVLGGAVLLLCLGIILVMFAVVGKMRARR